MTDERDPLGQQELLEFLYRAPVGLVQADLDGHIELINPMSAQLLMPLLSARGMDNLFDVLDPVIPQLRSMSAATRDEPDAVICDSLRLRVAPTHVHRPGSVLSLSVLRTTDGRLIAVLFDSTREVMREQDRLARRLADAAHTDALTGLPSRAAAVQRLDQALSRVGRGGSRGLAILCLNADRFRQVNDALGVGVGNQLLAQVGQQLRDALVERRRQVTGDHGEAPFAARVSADEFVIVLEDVADSAPLGDFARTLLTRLALPRQLEDGEVWCTFSAGLVMEAGHSGHDGLRTAGHEQLLQDASIAMRCAKRAGGDRLALFRTDMRVQAAQRAKLETELRHALVGHELFVVYQPVLSLDDSGSARRYTVVGVEALVRWQHPDRGVVLPEVFIPLAEECGLIGEIGARVLAVAIRQFLAMRQRLGVRAPPTLAVNLSRAQLVDAGFAAELAHCLAETGMCAQDLQLEVTESLAAQDEQVQHCLRELKALGVAMALDDFGTGYSSLSSLHLLPVDTIKIDRSFVGQADSSAHHRVLINATIQVANSLGMRTIAEGVETQAQCDAVRAAGCAQAQGQLWSAPLAAAELEAWLMTAPLAGG